MFTAAFQIHEALAFRLLFIVHVIFVSGIKAHVLAADYTKCSDLECMIDVDFGIKNNAVSEAHHTIS